MLRTESEIYLGFVKIILNTYSLGILTSLFHSTIFFVLVIRILSISFLRSTLWLLYHHIVSKVPDKILVKQRFLFTWTVNNKKATKCPAEQENKKGISLSTSKASSKCFLIKMSRRKQKRFSTMSVNWNDNETIKVTFCTVTKQWYCEQWHQKSYTREHHLKIHSFVTTSCDIYQPSVAIIIFSLTITQDRQTVCTVLRKWGLTNVRLLLVRCKSAFR